MRKAVLLTISIVVLLFIVVIFSGQFGVKSVVTQPDKEQEWLAQYIKLAEKMTTDDLYEWLMTQNEASTTDFASLETSRFDKIDIFLNEFEWRVGHDTSVKARSQENAVLDKYGPCWSKQGHCSE